MSLKNAANNVVRNCLEVQAGENVLIVVDGHTRSIGNMLSEETKTLGAEPIVTEMIPRQVNGEEPPKTVAESMKNVDVVIAPTVKSISHTSAVREAKKNGARIATMPGITEDMMIRTLGADYNEIKERSLKLKDKLMNVKNINIKTSLGTDVTMNFEGREFLVDTGIIEEYDMGNLPGGEVCLAPVEGTSNGVVYIDGVMAGVGLIENPIKFVIKDGYVEKIEGEEEAETLKTMLNRFEKEAYNVAELGIGTNDMAKLTGKVLEDEKVLGTVHIAVGNSMSFGGKVDVPIHLDGVIKNPTLIADDKTIIKDGDLNI